MALSVVVFSVPALAPSCLPPLGERASASDAAHTAPHKLQPAAGKISQTFTLPDLEGTRHELTQLAGRVVLVHFFATWREPCREAGLKHRASDSATASLHGDSA